MTSPLPYSVNDITAEIVDELVLTTLAWAAGLESDPMTSAAARAVILRNEFMSECPCLSNDQGSVAFPRIYTRALPKRASIMSVTEQRRAARGNSNCEGLTTLTLPPLRTAGHGITQRTADVICAVELNFARQASASHARVLVTCSHARWDH
jgi:hypothetical protein